MLLVCQHPVAVLDRSRLLLFLLFLSFLFSSVLLQPRVEFFPFSLFVSQADPVRDLVCPFFFFFFSGVTQSSTGCVALNNSVSRPPRPFHFLVDLALSPLVAPLASLESYWTS